MAQLVAHSLGVREVGRSNRLAPTIDTASEKTVKNLVDSYHPFILIPAYHAEQTIGTVITRLKARCDLSILVIDDGSPDRTSECARQAGADVITLSKNQGKGNAIRTGMLRGQELGYTHAICIDADGQHDESEIDLFMRHPQQTDIVIGRRTFASPMPFHRRLSNTLTSQVLSIATGLVLPDSQSGYRRYRLAVVCKWPLVSSRFDFETEVLFAAGQYGGSVGSVPASTHYGNERSSIHGLREIRNFLFQFWKFLWR